MDGFLADITRSGLTAGKVVLLGLIGLNLFTFLLYGLDKYKSRHRMWRVPESTLLPFALAGGTSGTTRHCIGSSASACLSSSCCRLQRFLR